MKTPMYEVWRFYRDRFYQERAQQGWLMPVHTDGMPCLLANSKKGLVYAMPAVQAYAKMLNFMHNDRFGHCAFELRLVDHETND